MHEEPVTTGAADQARVAEVLSTTRAMRRLSSEPIPHDVLERILRTAHYAPASDREAKVRLVVIDYAAVRAQIAEEIDEILGVPTDGSFRLAGLVPLGVPLGRWGVPRRPDLSETTSRNHWAESWPSRNKGETP
jgi:Nitroreductase family